MTTSNKSQSQPIEIRTDTNEGGLDFSLSPSEPGKFDFYRVHLTNQGQKKDSMFSDHYDTPNSPTEIRKHWSPFANLKHLSDQPKVSSSSSALYSPSVKSSTDLDLTSKPLNKPIQTVASFSSLTDAVKNAMRRGDLNPTINQLRRSDNATTLSSKDLNHLSPQSM